MAKPQLYKPMPKWHVGAAFGAAVLLHFMAVVVAGIRPDEEITDLTDIPEAVAEVTFEQQDQPPEPEPPPDEPEPPPPPPPTAEQPEFVEEEATPPPKPRTPSNKPPPPISRPRPPGPTGPVSMSTARVSAISSPRPEYPYAARKNRITGSGVCLMTVNPSTGAVTSAVMAQSTGSSVLDNAATSAFKRWRFKPNTVTKVRTPITFTMSGAQF